MIAFFLVFIVIKTRDSSWAKNFGFIPILAISITNFTMGGFDNTGIYWTVVLPLVSVYICGRSVGGTVNLIYIVIALIYFAGTKNGIFIERYTDLEFITYILSYLAVFVMTYVFYTSWAMSSELQLNEKTHLDEAKNEAEQRLTDLKRSQIDLEVSLAETLSANKELEKVNSLVLERETRMIDLKKRVEELEKRLERSESKQNT